MCALVHGLFVLGSMWLLGQLLTQALWHLSLTHGMCSESYLYHCIRNLLILLDNQGNAVMNPSVSRSLSGRTLHFEWLFQLQPSHSLIPVVG